MVGYSSNILHSAVCTKPSTTLIQFIYPSYSVSAEGEALTLAEIDAEIEADILALAEIEAEELIEADELIEAEILAEDEIEALELKDAEIEADELMLAEID